MSRRSWTRSPDVRREQLLTAAMSLFADRGADVTVSEITRAAGVSKGTFYVYFESKTELIAQLRDVVIADHRLQMEKAIADNSPLGMNSDFSPEAVEVAIRLLVERAQFDPLPDGGRPGADKASSSAGTRSS